MSPLLDHNPKNCDEPKTKSFQVFGQFAFYLRKDKYGKYYGTNEGDVYAKMLLKLQDEHMGVCSTPKYSNKLNMRTRKSFFLIVTIHFCFYIL